MRAYRSILVRWINEEQHFAAILPYIRIIDDMREPRLLDDLDDTILAAVVSRFSRSLWNDPGKRFNDPYVAKQLAPIKTFIPFRVNIFGSPTKPEAKGLHHAIDLHIGLALPADDPRLVGMASEGDAVVAEFDKLRRLFKTVQQVKN